MRSKTTQRILDRIKNQSIWYKIKMGLKIEYGIIRTIDLKQYLCLKLDL